MRIVADVFNDNSVRRLHVVSIEENPI